MTSPLVKRYLIALGKYWFAIPIGILAGVAGGLVFGSLQPLPDPTSYRIEGVLRYTRPAVTFSETGTAIQEQGQQLSQEELLVPTVLEAVAARPDVIEEVRQIAKVTVRPDRDDPSKLSAIYETTNEEQGLIIVAALMEEMVGYSRQINTARQRAIIEEINKRLPGVLEEIRDAEQTLEQFIRREQTVLLAIQAGQLPGAITGSQEQQRQIQLQLEGIDAQMRSLESQLGLTPEQAYASAALSADPIIADLRARLYQNETQMQLFEQDLRPDHPTIVQLQRDRESTLTLLEERAAEVIGGNGIGEPLPSGNQIRHESSLDPARRQLAQTLVGLQTQRESLERQLQVAIDIERELRQRYESLPNKQLEQARLQQQLELKRGFYNAMQTKLIDAQTAEAETVSSLRIAEPPRVTRTQTPSPPLPIWLLLPAGGAGGLVLGSALVFLLGSLDGILQTMEDLREFLREREVAVLEILPFVDVYDPKIGEQPIVVPAHSPYLEFYERFRSQLRQIEGKPKIVLLTSTLRNEGKTVSAYNLAIASARAGKRTLLIEADLRSPSNSKSLQVSLDPASTVEPLLYYGQLNECIQLVSEVENLYIVPSFGPHSQVAALIESAEMRQLLEDARSRFDFVVIDSSALSLCNDALLLEPYTDGIVLVTRPGYTGSSMLAESVDRLADSEEFRLLGAIINGEDIPIRQISAGQSSNSINLQSQQPTVFTHP